MQRLDHRGRLFWDLAAVIKAARPRAFLLENVKGLVSHDGGQTLRIVLETLVGLGYGVHHAILNARDYGVPQNRERIYIVGFRGIGRNFRYPPPTDPSRALREVLETEPVAAKYYVAEDALAAMRRRKARHESKGNGFGYRVLDPDGVSHALVRMKGLFAAGRAIGAGKRLLAAGQRALLAQEFPLLRLLTPICRRGCWPRRRPPCRRCTSCSTTPVSNSPRPIPPP